MRKRIVFAVVAGLSCLSLSAQAQQAPLTVPQPSPAAAVEQSVGVTQFRVTYHRPAVAGRKVWGDLVPYNEVWRAGANENTTLTASTPFKLAGKAVAAGTYGVHMIPGDKQWTVILSNQSGAWGSFTYDQKEDVVRVTATPQASEAMEERLSYRFDDPTDTSTTLSLRWEKLKVPVKIEVDTPAAVMAHMRAELRGLANFNGAAWDQAARYWLANGGSLDEATAFVDKSIAAKETYHNLMTKALIADKKGDSKAAQALRAKADPLATEVDINLLGYEQLGQKKLDEAIATFKRNTKSFPTSWNTFDSLGEALAIKGDKGGAAASYKKALALVKDDANKKRIEATIQRLEKSSG
jgi:predicted negative regulator of RcsB-dependent stress response